MKVPADHPELRLRTDPKAARLAKDVMRLVEILRGRGWCTAKRLLEIEASFRRSKRRLRAIAAASDGAIVSWTGSPGYRLFDETFSEGDLDHAVRAYGSQIEEMQARLTDLLRRHHQRNLIRNSDVSESEEAK